MRRITPSRRDDLISLAYALSELYQHHLPWSGYSHLPAPYCFNKVLFACSLLTTFTQLIFFSLLPSSSFLYAHLSLFFSSEKKKTDASRLFRDMPAPFEQFYNIVSSLSFSADPDYKALRDPFITWLEENVPQNDRLFDWERVEDVWQDYTKIPSYLIRKIDEQNQIERQNESEKEKENAVTTHTPPPQTSSIPLSDFIFASMIFPLHHNTNTQSPTPHSRSSITPMSVLPRNNLSPHSFHPSTLFQPGSQILSHSHSISPPPPPPLSSPIQRSISPSVLK